MKATLSLAIGLCVACVAILIALHVLEPGFNPPHLISEYQLGRFGWTADRSVFRFGLFGAQQQSPLYGCRRAEAPALRWTAEFHSCHRGKREPDDRARDD